MVRKKTLRLVLPVLLCCLFIFGVCSSQDTISSVQLLLERQHIHGPNGYYYHHGNPFTGVSVDTFPNGQTKRAAHYENGMLHGIYQSWFNHGQIHLKQEYHRGMRNGQLTYWYENGQKKSVSFYYMNLPYDTAYKWYENGKLKFLEYQALGDTIVRHYDCYHPNGQLKCMVRPDFQKRWHENGRKAEFGRLMQNQQVGTWKLWDANGKLIRKERFERKPKPGN